MPYTLLYHPEVVEQDLPPIPLNVHQRIARAIEARLNSAPEQHGEPLKGTLKAIKGQQLPEWRGSNP